jgi:hypothetical protein
LIKIKASHGVLASAGGFFETAGLDITAEGAQLEAGRNKAAMHSHSASTTSCVRSVPDSKKRLQRQRHRSSSAERGIPAVDFSCIFALMTPISWQPLRQQMREDYTSKEKARITAGAVTALVIVAWLAVIALAFLSAA